MIRNDDDMTSVDDTLSNTLKFKCLSVVSLQNTKCCRNAICSQATMCTEHDPDSKCIALGLNFQGDSAGMERYTQLQTTVHTNYTSALSVYPGGSSYCSHESHESAKCHAMSSHSTDCTETNHEYRTSEPLPQRNGTLCTLHRHMIVCNAMLERVLGLPGDLRALVVEQMPACGLLLLERHSRYCNVEINLESAWERLGHKHFSNQFSTWLAESGSHPKDLFLQHHFRLCMVAVLQTSKCRVPRPLPLHSLRILSQPLAANIGASIQSSEANLEPNIRLAGASSVSSMYLGETNFGTDIFPSEARLRPHVPLPRCGDRANQVHSTAKTRANELPKSARDSTAPVLCDLGAMDRLLGTSLAHLFPVSPELRQELAPSFTKMAGSDIQARVQRKRRYDIARTLRFHADLSGAYVHTLKLKTPFVSELLGCGGERLFDHAESVCIASAARCVQRHTPVQAARMGQPGHTAEERKFRGAEGGPETGTYVPDIVGLKDVPVGMCLRDAGEASTCAVCIEGGPAETDMLSYTSLDTSALRLSHVPKYGVMGTPTVTDTHVHYGENTDTARSTDIPTGANMRVCTCTHTCESAQTSRGGSTETPEPTRKHKRSSALRCVALPNLRRVQFHNMRALSCLDTVIETLTTFPQLRSVHFYHGDFATERRAKHCWVTVFTAIAQLMRPYQLRTFSLVSCRGLDQQAWHALSTTLTCMSALRDLEIWDLDLNPARASHDNFAMFLKSVSEGQVVGSLKSISLRDLHIVGGDVAKAIAMCVNATHRKPLTKVPNITQATDHPPGTCACVHHDSQASCTTNTCNTSDNEARRETHTHTKSENLNDHATRHEKSNTSNYPHGQSNCHHRHGSVTYRYLENVSDKLSDRQCGPAKQSKGLGGCTRHGAEVTYKYAHTPRESDAYVKSRKDSNVDATSHTHTHPIPTTHTGPNTQTAGRTCIAECAADGKRRCGGELWKSTQTTNREGRERRVGADTMSLEIRAGKRMKLSSAEGNRLQIDTADRLGTDAQPRMELGICDESNGSSTALAGGAQAKTFAKTYKDCNVSDIGVQGIARASLNVNNRVLGAGSEAQAQSSSVGLEKLVISDCTVTPDFIAILQQALDPDLMGLQEFQITGITCEINTRSTLFDLQHLPPLLRKVPNISTLRLQFERTSSSIFTESIQVLSTFRQLKHISLAGSMLATRGSPLLSDMSAGIAGLLRSRVGETLSSLDLSRCRLSANFAAPELVSALAHSGVTELLLNDNRLEDVGIIQLSGVFAYGTCKLRRLELAGNRLKKNGLEQLIERIASSDVKLRVLDIGSSQPIDIRGYVQENFAARTRLRLQLHGITVLRSTDGATVAEGFDPY